MFALAFTVFFISLTLSATQSSDDYKCIQCLCHARTGCWSRPRCATYSVSPHYWEMSGKPRTKRGSPRYEDCKLEEDCIVRTIMNYTSRFGDWDTNCDGQFDCKDRLAIHLYDAAAKNPLFSRDYVRRFNECHMNMNLTPLQETYPNCS